MSILLRVGRQLDRLLGLLSRLGIVESQCCDNLTGRGIANGAVWVQSLIRAQLSLHFGQLKKENSTRRNQDGKSRILS
jgi:hypothetical protein